MDSVYQSARAFIYRNARPIDLARWQYHFEGGSAQAVLQALSAYQNGDGGFGHALEADCWNPASSPIQAWEATEILHAMGHPAEAQEIVEGLVRYLESGADGDEDGWYNSVSGNRDHPHAPWWEPQDQPAASDNPTACLAGFLLLHAHKGNPGHHKAQGMAKAAGERLLAAQGLGDMHLIACYIRLVEYVQLADETELFSLQAAQEKLQKLVKESIGDDAAAWEGYVCRPSHYALTRESPYYEANRQMAELEAQWMKGRQLPDGSWNIPWGWDDYPEQWALSKNWWKSNVILKNLLFMRGLGQL